MAELAQLILPFCSEKKGCFMQKFKTTASWRVKVQ